MAIDGIGSSGFMPSSFPDVGSIGSVEAPPPLPDVGGADDVSPSSGFGFSGESGFDAGGKVDPSSMLAMQAPMSRSLRTGDVEAPSALSALSGKSDFEAGPARSARAADAAAPQAVGGDEPTTREAREATRTSGGEGENLARGSRGTDVRQLQEQLKRAGFDPGPLDGKFGPLTEAAVRRFQQARGLDTDGVAGPITKGALGQARQPATGEQAAPGGRARGAGGPQGAAQPGGAQRTQGADTPAPRGSGRTQEFLRQALSQNGNRYVFGAEASPNNANPRALDCSELVEWAAARAGVRFPDGSANQIAAARPMSVEQALRTPGALLYRPGHIAISLGDGRTIEARNSRAGVGIFNANGRGWTRAGTIPGMQ
ncbi:MAG: peptidoglycan-binding protein [Myxococcaceae bacterium]|jgi:peptidoglycan hydrolase-like protein with peptidoglycan-binding domain|nr:peptidoglycan-binding protein [Myxococcaceae bacterium]